MAFGKKNPFAKISDAKITAQRLPNLEARNVQRNLDPSVDPKKNVVRADPASYICELQSIAYKELDTTDLVEIVFRVIAVCDQGLTPLGSICQHGIWKSNNSFLSEMKTWLACTMNVPPDWIDGGNVNDPEDKQFFFQKNIINAAGQPEMVHRANVNAVFGEGNPLCNISTPIYAKDAGGALAPTGASAMRGVCWGATCSHTKSKGRDDPTKKGNDFFNVNFFPVEVFRDSTGALLHWQKPAVNKVVGAGA